MSKIQDLLAAQRSKQNGSTPQPVLQSKPTETAKPVEAQRPLTLQEKLAKKSAISPVNTGTKQANGIGISEQSSGGNSVVEQGPLENEKAQETGTGNIRRDSNVKSDNSQEQKAPETAIRDNSSNDRREENKDVSAPIMPTGLSLLQQMKWKKEHAPQQNKTDPKPNPSANNVGLVDKKETISNLPAEKGSELSASQAADKEKSNDGLANIEELRANLLYLANNIENKDIVSGVIRTIGLQLKNSPELTPHMTNADVNLVVRGARSAYQLAAMAKQSKEDNKKGRSKQLGEVDLIFKDAGIDFSALNFKG